MLFRLKVGHPLTIIRAIFCTNLNQEVKYYMAIRDKVIAGVLVAVILGIGSAYTQVQANTAHRLRSTDVLNRMEIAVSKLETNVEWLKRNEAP